MTHCCWPCMCDAYCHLQAEDMDVSLAGGDTQTFTFLVIGNPCPNNNARISNGESSLIPAEAPDVVCSLDGTLEAATTTPNGNVIIGMLFPESTGTTYDSHSGADTDASHSETDTTTHITTFDANWEADASDIIASCQERANQNHAGGMGTISIDVFNINPLTTSETKQGYC